MVVDSNLHALSSKDVGRANQYRVAQFICHFLCLLGGKDRSSGRTWNLTLCKNLVKKLPVLCCIHILRRSTEDRNSHLHQRLGQLDGCLTTKLHNRSVRFFDVDDTLYIFRRQRLEVKFVRNVKIRADRLRVIVDNDRLVAFFLKGPGTVYGAEVKLDPLTDPDRAGT